MSGRKKETKNEGHPGPGSYKIKNFYEDIPGSIIGKNRRNTSMAKTAFTPGPGQYNSEIPSNLTMAPRVKFGFGEREKSYDKASSPGPGQY
jgi:hypothetical protein